MKALDFGPIGCGELVMRLAQEMRSLAPGEIVELRTYDPGAQEDIPAWCRMTGNDIVEQPFRGCFIIRKNER